MNTRPGETYWAASDIGWVVGHSYIVVGALTPRMCHCPLRGKTCRHPRCGSNLACHRGASGHESLCGTNGTSSRAPKGLDARAHQEVRRVVFEETVRRG